MGCSVLGPWEEPTDLAEETMLVVLVLLDQDQWTGQDQWFGQEAAHP